jgi:hypothetical protein
MCRPPSPTRYRGEAASSAAPAPQGRAGIEVAYPFSYTRDPREGSYLESLHNE